MKIEINQAYKNQRLLEAEVAGRSQTQQRLDRIAIGIGICFILICSSPIILVCLKTNWTEKYNELPSVSTVHKSLPIGMVTDDEWHSRSVIGNNYVYGSAD